MGIMSVLGGVFNVGNIDSNASVPLFRSIVNGTIITKLGKGRVFCGQDLSDSGSQCCLAMVNMSNGANVAVRLVSLEDLLLKDNAAGRNVSLAAKCKNLRRD